MSAQDDPRTARTLSAFFDVVRSAEMIAGGGAAAPRPRDVLAARIRGFVGAFDREKAWPAGGGDYGEHTLRRRALAVADVLDIQAARVRMTK